ncbi:hypothetical protein V1478_001272 [Vespula squamosa]|uniref:Secreted protein n=1 Tax=Vespula squamosa TaxID=30214 RepID=A0ABD2C0Z5_VESSQ
MRHTTSFVSLLVFVFSTVVEKGRQLEQCEEMEIGGQRRVLSMTTDRFLQSFFNIQGEPYDQLKIGCSTISKVTPFDRDRLFTNFLYKLDIDTIFKGGKRSSSAFLTHEAMI